MTSQTLKQLTRRMHVQRALTDRRVKAFNSEVNNFNFLTRFPKLNSLRLELFEHNSLITFWPQCYVDYYNFERWVCTHTKFFVPMPT